MAGRVIRALAQPPHPPRQAEAGAAAAAPHAGTRSAARGAAQLAVALAELAADDLGNREQQLRYGPELVISSRHFREQNLLLI